MIPLYILAAIAFGGVSSAVGYMRGYRAAEDQFIEADEEAVEEAHVTDARERGEIA